MPPAINSNKPIGRPFFACIRDDFGAAGAFIVSVLVFTRRLDLPLPRRRSVSRLDALAVSALIASQICAPGDESGIGSTTGAGLFRCVSASATADDAFV